MTIETTTAPAFDFNQKFESSEAAQSAASAADLSNFRITKVQEGEWIIIDAKGKPAASEGKAKLPKVAKGKAKAKADAKPQKAGKADAKAKADLAKAKADKAANPNGGKDMHYSAETLPSREEIEAGLKGMGLSQRDHFKAALEGKLPDYDIFKLSRKEKDKDGKDKMESELTHMAFRGRRDELYALRNKGRRDPEAALKEALAWREGNGTRMTCSSTIPLGRFHQQLIFALKAKIAAKKKAAKGNGKPEPAPEAQLQAKG